MLQQELESSCHGSFTFDSQGNCFVYLCLTMPGFGMMESQIQIAFKKYTTIPNPNKNKVDSFGLGLPITKQLVELQHGTIEMRSKLNEGTEVILRFPYLMQTGHHP